MVSCSCQTSIKEFVLPLAAVVFVDSIVKSSLLQSLAVKNAVPFTSRFLVTSNPVLSHALFPNGQIIHQNPRPQVFVACPVVVVTSFNSVKLQSNLHSVATLAHLLPDMCHVTRSHAMSTLKVERMVSMVLINPK